MKNLGVWLALVKSVLVYKNWASRMNFFDAKEFFFTWFLISKMAVNMNLTIITKNHAADPENL